MKRDKGEAELQRLNPCSAVWDDGEEPVSFGHHLIFLQASVVVDTHVTETLKTNYKEPMNFQNTLGVGEGSEKSGGSMNSSLTNVGRKLGKTSSQKRKLLKQGS